MQIRVQFGEMLGLVRMSWRFESGSQLHLVVSLKCQIVDQMRIASAALRLSAAACDMKGSVAFVLVFCELKGHAE